MPEWANQKTFDRLDEAGLMMYGQMTAGSWIYIGTQGILQGTYQTLVSCAEKDFGAPTLKGKFLLTAGMGGMSAFSNNVQSLVTRGPLSDAAR